MSEVRDGSSNCSKSSSTMVLITPTVITWYESCTVNMLRSFPSAACEMARGDKLRLACESNTLVEVAHESAYSDEHDDI
eukprot:1143894-Pelagomonas_calceolata.AAC.2